MGSTIPAQRPETSPPRLAARPLSVHGEGRPAARPGGERLQAGSRREITSHRGVVEMELEG